jgi:sialic acid synthase SpsE
MEFENSLIINRKKVGPGHKTYFIADIAANHDGDLSRAKDLIYLAAEAGADAAKFQHFQAKTIVSEEGFSKIGPNKSHQSKWKKSVTEVYEAASVNLDWTETLMQTCDEVNIPFFTTPYSLEVIDHLDRFVPAYKIGSGDITWKNMIEKVAKQGKPYFIACGASSLDDVVRAVDWATCINRQIGLMQCNTNYTASLENFKYINLNVIKTLRQMYPSMVLGLSDHTPKHSTVLGAVALGASMIEKHFTDDNTREGPDHPFSMDPNAWREMVERTRELEMALGGGIKVVEKNEYDAKIVQRRSLRASQVVEAGKVIEEGDFLPLRPCPDDAISPSQIQNIIGKKLRKTMSKGDYLRETDLQ